MQSFRTRPRRRRSRSATPPPPGLVPSDTAAAAAAAAAALGDAAAAASSGPSSLPRTSSLPPPPQSASVPHASSSEGEGIMTTPRKKEPSGKSRRIRSVRKSGGGGVAAAGPTTPKRQPQQRRQRQAQFRNLPHPLQRSQPQPQQQGGARRGKREKTRAELLAFAGREFASAAVRTVLACLLRVAVVLLAASAAGEWGQDTDGEEDERGVLLRSVLPSAWGRRLGPLLSVPASALLFLLPAKAAQNVSPGFAFAFPPLLILLHRWSGGSVPSVPCRVGETVMGRLTYRELAVVVPVHFLGAIAGAALVRLALPGAFTRAAVDPIIYSEGNPWLYDLTREVVANAIFAVGVLTVPELCRLNRLPRSATLLLALYPLFNVAVDASGKASAFGPDVVYALRCVTRREEVPIGQSPHMLGPILGGALGGKIMTWFFPDE